MKIRAFVVTTNGRTDPIKNYLLREEPPMGAGAWASYHYAATATHGVVLVRYDEAVFDPAPLASLTGVIAVPPERLDRPQGEVTRAKRDAVKSLCEQRGGTLDESRLVTWEDAICELMRRNGNPEQTTLRKTASQRTREFLGAFE